MTIVTGPDGTRYRVLVQWADEVVQAMFRIHPNGTKGMKVLPRIPHGEWPLPGLPFQYLSNDPECPVRKGDWVGWVSEGVIMFFQHEGEGVLSDAACAQDHETSYLIARADPKEDV